MCAGAIVAARIERVVFGCPRSEGRRRRQRHRRFASEAVNHRVEVTGGVLADETAAQLRAFFASRRGRSAARPPGAEGEAVL